MPFKFVIIGRPYNAEHEKTKEAAAKQSQLKTLEKGKTYQAQKEGKRGRTCQWKAIWTFFTIAFNSCKINVHHF